MLPRLADRPSVWSSTCPHDPDRSRPVGVRP